jgi:hypothetical protein
MEMSEGDRSAALEAMADRTPDGDAAVRMLADGGELTIYHDQRAYPQGEWLADLDGGVDLARWR